MFEVSCYIVCVWSITKIIVIDKISEHFGSTCFSSVARHQLDWKVISWYLNILQEIVSRNPLSKNLWWTLESTFYFSGVVFWFNWQNYASAWCKIACTHKRIYISLFSTFFVYSQLSTFSLGQIWLKNCSKIISRQFFLNIISPFCRVKDSCFLMKSGAN